MRKVNHILFSGCLSLFKGRPLVVRWIKLSVSYTTTSQILRYVDCCKGPGTISTRSDWRPLPTTMPPQIASYLLFTLIFLISQMIKYLNLRVVFFFNINYVTKIIRDRLFIMRKERIIFFKNELNIVLTEYQQLYQHRLKQLYTLTLTQFVKPFVNSSWQIFILF